MIESNSSDGGTPGAGRKDSGRVLETGRFGKRSDRRFAMQIFIKTAESRPFLPVFGCFGRPKRTSPQKSRKGERTKAGCESLFGQIRRYGEGFSPLRIVQNPDVDFFFRIFGIAVEKGTDEHFVVPAKSGVLKKAQKKLIGDGIDPVVLV